MGNNIFSGRTYRTPSCHQRIFLICLFLILSLAVLTRYQLLNGFTLLPGDRYDVVISTTILEHWFRFFLGESSWSDVSYFFPYTLTIAHTDAFFLNGLAYLPFRLIGLDPYISAEFSGLVVKSAGFIGTYVLCRKAFSFSCYWALLAAILFTLSNGMTVHSHRYQLATVAFSPIMATLLWSTFKAFLDGDLTKFRRTGLITGIFFGAWCLTCFYMAWFFTFFFTFFTVAILVMNDRVSFLILKDRLVGHYGSVMFVAGSVFISLIPFAYAFIPKSQETGVRIYEEAHAWTVPIEGILQVGQENVLLGGFYNSILAYVSPTYIPHGEYYNTGFPIALFLLFLIGCVQTIKHANQNGTSSILPPLVIATLITWMLVLNINGYSAWFFIFHVFPGAKALRVVSAYQIFLALPVVIIAVRALSMSRIGLPISLLMCSLLVTEEINKPYLMLDRQTELERISLPYLPPKECHVFYTSGWEGQERLGMVDNIYAHNVSAMLIAQFAKIPTINGIASFNPVDANFASPNKSDYDERVFHYSKKHDITSLCKLDLNSKRWTKVSDLDVERASINIPFFNKSAWEGRILSTQGLSSFENWGTWSASDVVTFEFNTPLPGKFNVYLTAQAFGPNIGKEFEAHVGDHTVKFSLSAVAEEKILEFDNPTGSRILIINIPAPMSPKELSKGQSGDDRSLGIGFVALKIAAF
jgi:hypothetical protein